MSHSSIEIPIIDGYSRIFFPVDGGLLAPLPSDKLLKELVNFPKVKQGYPHPSDPFNVDCYRFRDRDHDLDNQLILQDRNNMVISSIYSCKHDILNLSVVERRINHYCNKYGIDFLSICYRLKVIDYCQKILPGTSANPEKSSKLITAFADMKIDFEDNGKRTYDFYDARNKSGVTKYFDKIDFSIESRKRRLPEFNDALNYIETIVEKPSFDDELHQIILEDTILINKNNERHKKQRTKNKNREDLDYRRLTQCLFCNRFHLQEPKRVLSRFCDRPECKTRNKAWIASLERKGIDLKNVSPSGF
jgi:hypothetical protein